MKTIGLICEWIFTRLPLLFSVPLVVLIVLYLGVAYPAIVYHGLPELVRCLNVPPGISDLLSALLGVGLLVGGILLAYSLAAMFYAHVRTTAMPSLQLHEPSLRGGPVQPGRQDVFAGYNRIGIILAGGGAKGAYQAGALQAIWEFLEEHGAHPKVKMLAGTSIGSWNAMFWLAGLIKDPKGGKGLLQQWWEQVDVSGVISPATYVPRRQNYLLSNDPWKDVFDRLFIAHPGARTNLEALLNQEESALNFYFTRSNVGRARLEFTTNNQDVGNTPENMPGERRPRRAIVEGTWDTARSVVDIKGAVFASMDLPPLFPYIFNGNGHYEDGGVIDNLPIRFGTEIEQCDLLFVLPLNASFAQEVNQRSITSRLFRVMNVRQGVMERNSFKLVYLYNELAALRRRAESVLLESPMAKTSSFDDLSARAESRRHKELHVVAVCPAPPLGLDTAEFWKTAAAAQAFRLMHTATTEQLKKFAAREDERGWVGVALVSPQGETTYLEDF